MFEDDWPRRIETNPQGYGQEKRGQTDNANEGAEQIKSPLDSPVIPQRQIVPETEGDNSTVDEGIGLEGGQGQAAHVGNESYFFDQ